MNSSILRLYQLAAKEERLILGLMSGTSLDGLDIALCRVNGFGAGSEVTLLNFVTMDYEAEFRSAIREVFAKRHIDQQQLCGLNALIGTVHAELINQALKSWGIPASRIDLIASHGQTVYHAPQSLTQDRSLPNSTLQLGDSDHIAVKTGIITLADFRQKHIAAGGEGAPLAAYGDYLLFSSASENRILLNIGGISNFTFLPKIGSDLQAYATDLGPGNTMMNQFMQQQFGLEMDRDAELAMQGKVDQNLLEALLTEEFLQLDFPKTTGPELFNLNYLENKIQEANLPALHPKDSMATLNAFSAETIIQGIRKATENLESFEVYVSGGGLHNPLLLNQLQDAFPNQIHSFMKLGIDPDAKEACLFAILANESVAGNPNDVANIKDSPAVCMGKISLPY